MSNYPAGVTDADFDDRGAFQGDVSRREVEITISVDAEMVNHVVKLHSRTAMAPGISTEVYRALIASWHEENDK